MHVPKIIHQTAPSDKSKWHEIWPICQQSWKTHFPDYEYRMWTDEDLERLIKTKYSWFYSTYMGYDRHIKRVDAARYFILYEYGGIYADMDFECMKNFEGFFPQDNVSIAASPHFEKGEFLQNALMISPAKHPFWVHVFNQLEFFKEIDNVLYATGPFFIQISIKLYKDNINILPSKSFAPVHTDEFIVTSETYQTNTNKHIFSRHHGTYIWAKYEPPPLKPLTNELMEQILIENLM